MQTTTEVTSEVATFYWKKTISTIEKKYKETEIQR